MQRVIDIQHGDAVSNAFIQGCTIVDKAVGNTMGPGGRCVISPGTRHYPKITKDGVSVAKQLSHADPHVSLAIDMLVQACNKQVNEVGDGTTLTAILSSYIYQNGVRLIKSGVNIREFVRDMQDAVEVVCAELDGEAHVISDESHLVEIATISANGDLKLGEMIGKAIYKIGEHGFVSYKRSMKTGHQVEYSDGIRLDTGIRYPAFCNTETGELFCDGSGTCAPFICVTDQEFSFAEELGCIMKVIETYNKEHSTNRPIIVFSPDIRDYALKAFIKNIESGRISGGWIRPSADLSQYANEYNLTDIAVITGAKLFSATTGNNLKNIKIEDMGQVQYIKSNPYATHIQAQPEKKELQKRVSSLKAHLNHQEISGLKEEWIKKSIARLTGGMAIFHIGGRVDTEQGEIMDRAEDAVLACNSAIRNGITHGGGVALLNLRKSLYANERPTEPGYQIIYDALVVPATRILNNYGRGDADLIVQQIVQCGGAYDLDGGYIADKTMTHLQVIDPVQVIMQAIRNSVSVASNMLQTSCSIAGKEIPDER